MRRWDTWDSTTKTLWTVGVGLLLLGIAFQIYGMLVPAASGWHSQILVGVSIVFVLSASARARRQDDGRR